MQKPRVFRMAMPVTLPSTLKDKMKGEGWFYDPAAEETPPDVGIKKLKEIDPATQLTLPRIYRYKPSEVKTINGKKYLVIYIEDPKDYKKLSKSVPQYVQDKIVNTNGVMHYPGLVRVINLEDGNVEEFTYDAVFSQIRQQSEALSEESRKRINQEIAAYNKRIDEIDSATANLTRIPLQIARAESMVKERVDTLDGMIGATESQISELNATKPASISEMEGHLEQAIKGGGLAEKDFIDYVVTHYAYRYDQLRKDLESGALQVPAGIPNSAEIKLRLMNIGQVAFDSYVAEKAKRIKEPTPAEPFDIEKQEITGYLQELPEGAVPASYKTKGYQNFQGYMGSLIGNLMGCKRDRARLVVVLDAFREIGQMLGSLPAGARSEETIKNTPQGQEILGKLADLCNTKLKGFTEHYSRSIVDEGGRLDTKTFGRSGSMGNALLVVVFTRLFKIISTFLKNSGYQKPDEAQAAEMAEAIDQPEGQPVPVQAPVQQASVKADIKTAQAAQPDGSWSPAMAAAYSAGLADGKSGVKPDPSKGKGFDACYTQGYEHGQKSKQASAGTKTAGTWSISPSGEMPPSQQRMTPDQYVTQISNIKSHIMAMPEGDVKKKMVNEFNLKFPGFSIQEEPVNDLPNPVVLEREIRETARMMSTKGITREQYFAKINQIRKDIVSMPDGIIKQNLVYRFNRTFVYDRM